MMKRQGLMVAAFVVARVAAADVLEVDWLTQDGAAATNNLTIAALLLTEHLYTHRGPTEGFSISIIPYGIDFWVKPFIKLTI